MSEVHYCKRWIRAVKKMREPWPAEQARAAHEAGDPYTAVIGDPKRPRGLVEVSGAFGRVVVVFFDGRLREERTYQFTKTEAGDLFLAMATLREFDGAREAVLAWTSHIFEEDGRLAIRKEWFHPQALDTRETDTDVGANHAPFPDFGDYDDLCREDRIDL